MSENRYKILKTGQSPLLDPGGTSRPFMTEDGFLLVKTQSESLQPPESSNNLIVNIDDTSSTEFTYVGEATPGSTNAGSDWRIFRFKKDGSELRYADAETSFDKTWDNRLGYTYS